jgi:hypothetical protein
MYIFEIFVDGLQEDVKTFGENRSKGKRENNLSLQISPNLWGQTIRFGTATDFQ